MSATDRMNLHVSMTLQLKDAAAGTSVPCKMPGCGAQVRDCRESLYLETFETKLCTIQVTYDQLKDHFLAHETSAGAGGEAGPGAVSFPCVACGLSFSRRSELDTHTRTKHGQVRTYVIMTLIPLNMCLPGRRQYEGEVESPL